MDPFWKIASPIIIMMVMYAVYRVGYIFGKKGEREYNQCYRDFKKIMKKYPGAKIKVKAIDRDLTCTYVIFGAGILGRADLEKLKDIIHHYHHATHALMLDEIVERMPPQFDGIHEDISTVFPRKKW